MLDKYEKKLFQLAIKAFKKGEVPVSAIIVRNNKILATAYNKRIKSSNPLYHAEIQCILKAAKKIKDWRLDDCDLYVTLKPCHMCEEIIKESRINNVYYLIDNKKNIKFKTNFIMLKDNEKKYEHLLTSFFKKLR